MPLLISGVKSSAMSRVLSEIILVKLASSSSCRTSRAVETLNGHSFTTKIVQEVARRHT